MEEVGGDDGAVGLADEDELIPVVVVQDGEDFLAHFRAGEGRVGDAEGDGEDLEGDEADLAGCRGEEFLEEGCVCVETDADAVDEEYWEVGCGGVRVVVVGKVVCWRDVGCKEAERGKGDGADDAGNSRTAIVGKAMPAEGRLDDQIRAGHANGIEEERPMKGSERIQSQAESCCFSSSLGDADVEDLFNFRDVALQFNILFIGPMAPAEDRPCQPIFDVLTLDLRAFCWRPEECKALDSWGGGYTSLEEAASFGPGKDWGMDRGAMQEIASG